MKEGGAGLAAIIMALRWGICGAGLISNDFVVSLRALPASEHKVVAVGARSVERANEFAATHDIPRAYGSYEEVAADEEVDVVYVGTIHPTHLAVCTMVLGKGKPVLCEKPLTMNVCDTETLLKTAQEKGLFFMEGNWMRFFPVMVELRRLLAEDAIGEIRHVNVTFSFRRAAEVGKRTGRQRLTDPELGGGSVLDVGVYALSFTNMVMREERPESIHAWGQLTEEGTDELAAITMIYKGGRIAQLTCGTAYDLPCEAVVCGTKGDIKIPKPFWCPTRLETPTGVKEYPLPEPSLPVNFPNGQGMFYEAEEVRRCLKEGKRESEVVTSANSLLVAEMAEEIMKQIGVIYFRD